MTLIEMSLWAGAIIALIMVFRSAALKKLPKTTFLALWSIAVLRLTVPFSFASNMNLYSLLDKITPRTQKGQAFILNAVHSSAAGIPALSIVWTVGAAITLSFFAVSYLAAMRRLRTALPANGSGTVADFIAEHKLRRMVAVCISDRVTTPLTCGVIRPRIILPKAFDLSDPSLVRHVLTHELVHIKRFDAVKKLVLIIVFCCHWFNPLVWALFVLANRDIELACDEKTLMLLGGASKADYAMFLIEQAQNNHVCFRPLCSDFCKNVTEERIVAIMKSGKSGVAVRICAASAVCVMAVVFAASAAVPKKTVKAAAPVTSGQTHRIAGSVSSGRAVAVTSYSFSSGTPVHVDSTENHSTLCVATINNTIDDNGNISVEIKYDGDNSAIIAAAGSPDKNK